MIFMQEEYEHHLRIKAHLVVALEALKDALYFLDRKTNYAEHLNAQNTQNIMAHQEIIQIQLGEALDDYDSISMSFQKVYHL